MKTARKVLMLVLCAALLVSATVAGTIAYLTDDDAVTNTFAVGKVYINLDEADTSTEDATDRTEEGNQYHLLPGQTYVKDPTVTVLKDSEESYVRMLVTVENLASLKNAFPADEYPDYYNGDVFLLQMLVEGWDNSIWVFEAVEDNVYEFRYHETVAKAEENTVLEPLFTSVVIPGEIDNEHLAYLSGVEIEVVAQAIQAAGFDTADAAWEAWTE